MSYPENLMNFKNKVTALQTAANTLPADQKSPTDVSSAKQALDAVNSAFSAIHS